MTLEKLQEFTTKYDTWFEPEVSEKDGYFTFDLKTLSPRTGEFYFSNLRFASYMKDEEIEADIHLTMTTIMIVEERMIKVIKRSREITKFL